MTQREKDLLTKDLCSRLPYGVKCEDKYGNVLELNGINNPNTVTFKCSDKTFWTTNLDECKPYLFPLSSMTEEQKSYLYFNTKFEVDMFGKLVVKMDSDDNYLYTDISDYTSIINWLIENKFDIHGLIPKGLAIDATGLDIYSNKNKTIMTIELKKLEYLNKELDTNYSSLNKVDWRMVSKNHKLSEDFIREFQSKVDWYYISYNQTLSEEFIREFKDKIDWVAISHKQTLSEEFIREFQDKVSWISISWKQKLSESFIREFENKVAWEYILKYQKVSENFIREFQYLTYSAI